MLYATDGVDSPDDLNKAMVGVASVWYVIILNLSETIFLTLYQVRRKPVRTLPLLSGIQELRSISSCNKHILGLGQRIKKSLVEADLIGYQFGTVGVSDGISMGTRGMSYSLQSRDLIADQVESAAGGHWLDGMVVVPGCDKNMPGVLMACKQTNASFVYHFIDNEQ